MNQIYSRQLGFFIFLYLLGSAFIYIPESVIGKDVWAATALAALLGLYLLYVLISIQLLYPHQSIMQITELAFGKVLGKLLNLVFLLNLLLIAVLILADNIRFTQLIYPTTPTILLSMALILFTSYILLQGVNVIGRWADFNIWLVVALVVLGLILISSLFKFSNVLPALINIKPIIGGALYGGKWPFTELIVIALYLPFVIDLKRNKNKLYGWFAFAALVLIVRSFLVLGILGAKYLEISHYPLYDVFRLIQFQAFARFELFFFALFITLMFTVVILSYGALVIGVKEFFNLHDTNNLVFPVGLLLITLTYKTFPSEVEFLVLNDASIFIILPIGLLYPTMVFIAAKIRSNL